jgi:hypothetical protein
MSRVEAIFGYGHTLQHLAARRKWLSFLLLDCIHPGVRVRVENKAGSLDSLLSIPAAFPFE